MTRAAAGRTGSLPHPERGAIALVVVVIFLSLVATIGLVTDGRRQLTAQQRADNVAAEAARAAGQEIDGGVVLGSTGVNRSRAVAAADAYLRASGVDGDVSVRGGTVVVTTTITMPATVLPVIDITTLRATGRATVDIVTRL